MVRGYFKIAKIWPSSIMRVWLKKNWTNYWRKKAITPLNIGNKNVVFKGYLINGLKSFGHFK